MLSRMLALVDRANPVKPKLARRLMAIDSTELAELRSIQALAIQHFIREEWSAFQAELEGGRARITNLHPDARARWSYLFDALEGGAARTEGDKDRAIRLYRQSIGTLDAMLGRPHPIFERDGQYEFFSNVLALLNVSLAEMLALADRPPDEVEAVYKIAVDHARRSPRMSMAYVCNMYGSYCAERARLDPAAEAFRLEALASPGIQARGRLKARLAYVDTKRAEDLVQKGDFATARDTLRRTRTELMAEIESLDSLPKPSDEDVGKDRKTLRDDLSLWIARTLYIEGDLFERSGRTDDSAQLFQQSADKYATFGSHGSAAYVSERRGDALLALDRSTEALEAYAAGAAYAAKDREQRFTRARLLAKAAGVRLLNTADTEAEALLDESRNIWLQDRYIDGYSRVARDMRTLRPSDEVLAALRARYAARLRGADSAETRRELVYGLREVFSSSAVEIHLEADGKPLINVVTPIRVDVEMFTSDAIDAYEQRLVKEAGAMRDRVLASTGVKLPGIRWKAVGEDEGGVRGEYSLLIHEVPRVTGSVVIGQVFVERPVEHYSTVTTPAAPRQYAPEGSWMPRRDAEAAGLPFLDPFQFVIRHLELVLRAHLVEMVGHQEVQNLLETHELVTAKRPGDIVAKEAIDHMGHITKIVRALVAERVPIESADEPPIAFVSIYAVFEKMRASRSSDRAIVDAVRLLPAIRPRLWGNNERFVFLRLADAFDASVADSVTKAANECVLLNRDVADSVIAAIRTTAELHPRLALVTRLQLTRGVLRNLIAPTLPDIPVLSLGELMPGLLRQVVGTVDPSGPQPSRVVAAT